MVSSDPNQVPLLQYLGPVLLTVDSSLPTHHVASPGQQQQQHKAVLLLTASLWALLSMWAAHTMIILYCGHSLHSFSTPLSSEARWTHPLRPKWRCWAHLYHSSLTHWPHKMSSFSLPHSTVSLLCCAFLYQLLRSIFAAVKVSVAAHWPTNWCCRPCYH